MYDLEFVYKECGFVDLPDYINHNLLFNISIDVATRDLKLYILDESERFVYKVSREEVTRQYPGDDPKYGGSLEVLMEYLGCQIDKRQVIVDAVENENYYYVYLDNASVKQGQLLFDALSRKSGITEADFLQSINHINQYRFHSLSQALSKLAVSLIRIPLKDGQIKVYARPFLNGKGFEFDMATQKFLERLYNAQSNTLPGLLTHTWIAQEVVTGRELVVTQNHKLLHKK